LKVSVAMSKRKSGIFLERVRSCIGTYWDTMPCL